MTLLTVTDLSVRYGKNIALQNMNLSLSAGEIVTIVGPNGSGKTTLFKAIIGSTPLSSGKVELKPDIKIGYVPPVSYTHLTLPTKR